MKKFILKRLGYACLSLLVLSLTIFLFVRVTGDPTTLLVEPGASKADIDVRPVGWAGPVQPAWGAPQTEAAGGSPSPAGVRPNRRGSATTGLTLCSARRSCRPPGSARAEADR